MKFEYHTPDNLVWGIVSKFPDCAYWTKTTERISLKIYFLKEQFKDSELQINFEIAKYLWYNSDECEVMEQFGIILCQATKYH